MISNAFNIDRVLAAMRGRLGWQQPTRGGVPTLTTANTTSASGRYYGEGFHENASLFRLFETQEDRTITEAEFNALLVQMDDEVTMKCLNAVFNNPQLIDNCLLFEREFQDDRTTALTNGVNFCGYRIKVAPGNYSVVIPSATLLFNGAATFNLYLFNDLRVAPLQTKSVTTVANDQVDVTLGWQLSNASATNKGGTFYIGYFQSDLGSVKALDDQYLTAAESVVFGAEAFESAHSGGLVFDRRTNSTNSHSYGLNLQMCSYRDYTETVVRNAHMFDEVRGLEMALRVIGQTVSSIRHNATKLLSGDMLPALLTDMNQSFPTEERPFEPGLKSRIAKELKRINNNFFPKAQLTSTTLDCGT